MTARLVRAGRMQEASNLVLLAMARTVQYMSEDDEVVELPYLTSLRKQLDEMGFVSVVKISHERAKQLQKMPPLRLLMPLNQNSQMGLYARR